MYPVEEIELSEKSIKSEKVSRNYDQGVQVSDDDMQNHWPKKAVETREWKNYYLEV